jgi:hypothetical protein
MQSLLTKVLLIVVVLGICLAANAGTRVDEVWRCTLNEGKTLEDVHAANGAWVKFVNAKVEGGDIHSYVATSIVGDSTQFLYVDSFPNMKAWIATKAEIETEQGQAIEAALNEIASCSSNSLYSSTETEGK